MPRSGLEARDRLERAALELYTERGYDSTTAADIAAKAGVTERTFFRHFADKREVLFNIEVSQRQALAQALAEVPGDRAAFDAVLQAFRSMVPLLNSKRSLAEARHHVVSTTPALRERELTKAAALGVVVADALRERGIPDWRADLQAQVSTAALGHAVHTWLADPTSNIDDLIVRAFSDLHEFAIGEPDESPTRA